MLVYGEIRAKLNDLEYANKRNRAYLATGCTGVGANNTGIVIGAILTFRIIFTIIGLPMWIGNAIAKSSKLKQRQAVYRTIERNETEIIV